MAARAPSTGPTTEVKESMVQETAFGTSWWAEQLTDTVPPHKITTFKDTLQALLLEKFKGHWDPSNIMRGSGYRAITADSHRLDPLLVKACEIADIPLPDFCRCVFKRGTDYIMFINPGEVRVRNGALLTTSSSVVWSLHPQPNPTSQSSTSNTPVTAGTNGGSASNLNPAHIGVSRGGLFTPTHTHHPYTPTSQQPHSTHTSHHHHHHHSAHNYTGSSSSHQQGQHTQRSNISIHAPSWVPDGNYHNHDYSTRTPRK